MINECGYCSVFALVGKIDYPSMDILIAKKQQEGLLRERRLPKDLENLGNYP